MSKKIKQAGFPNIQLAILEFIQSKGHLYLSNLIETKNAIANSFNGIDSELSNEFWTFIDNKI